MLNVARDGEVVRFEFRRRGRFFRHIEFSAPTEEDARQLAARLPQQRSPGFDDRWAETREFNRRVRSLNTLQWVTPALLILNTLVFTIMAILQHRLGGFDPQAYLTWGANFGPLTLNGQPWRLVTALFVHANLLHLLLNMWVLWNVGRLTEALYGNGRLLFLYFAAGVLASLTSLLWHPDHYSVGASGAIFGLLGAFLAFLTHSRTQVPLSVLRTHWLSTVLFVAYNLVNGFLTPEIDNAAHVGGLVGGFTLGWMLAQPLDPNERTEFAFRQVLRATGLAALAILALFWQEQGFGARLSAPEQFMISRTWFVTGEAENLRNWQGLLNRAGAGLLAEDEIANRFERDILPFWAKADVRLKKEADFVPATQRQIAALLAEVVRLRLQWIQAIISTERHAIPAPPETPLQLASKTDYAVARIEQLTMRAARDRRPLALADSQLVKSLRRMFYGYHWTCVEDPFWPHARKEDSAQDGPARRREAGCTAQRLLMSGDYAALDAALRRASSSLADLPDETSTLHGMLGGLDHLFQFGNLTVDEGLRRTSDWRRAVPGSIWPDLAEAQLFDAWAWSARGFGGASSVSPEAWGLFAHRLNLAAAALEDTKERAASNPWWYELSLEVGMARDQSVDELRSIFDAGMRVAPRYFSLYSAMLHILMPRWKGSYQKIDHFIEEVTDRQNSKERDVELYARLYWEYDALERDDIRLFDDALAVWPLMKEGFGKLVKAHPNSDALLNAFARFACLGQDRITYLELRPRIALHRSSVVWTQKTSIESCDKEFSPSLPGITVLPGAKP